MWIDSIVNSHLPVPALWGKHWKRPLALLQGTKLSVGQHTLVPSILRDMTIGAISLLSKT